MSMIIPSPLPPTGAEVWRNAVAAEIQNNPERYALTGGFAFEPEARALAAGELARRDFNGPEPELEPEPVNAEFTDVPKASNSLVVAARWIFGTLSVAIVVIVLLAYATQSGWR
ncbi:hypothetical protein EEB13_05375 [Rhodococcus sp. WS3]|nr:hypothetical protein EEB13_05375 [Rhodococcus sp. WS3]